MRFKPWVSLSLCATTLGVIAVVQAQNASKGAKVVSNSKAEESQPGDVRVVGDNSVADMENRVFQLNKNVTVTQMGEDFILYAQKLTYFEKQNKARAQVGLKVETRDSTIRGNDILANFDEKTITFTGNVVINTHGSGDGITGNRKGSKRKASKITCRKVVWDYETHQAILTGDIQLQQEKNFGTCDRIEYDEEQNVAVLIDNVRFKNAENQVFNTSRFVVYMDADKSRSEGRISVGIPVTKSKTPRPAKKPMTFGVPPEIPKEDLNNFEVTKGIGPAPDITSDITSYRVDRADFGTQARGQP